MTNPKARRHNLIGLIDGVAAEFGVTTNDIRGQSRHREIADARAMAMLLLKRAAGLPDEIIGLIFNRARPSVIAAANQMRGLLDVSSTHRQHYKNIIAKYPDFDFIKNENNP